MAQSLLMGSYVWRMQLVGNWLCVIREYYDAVTMTGAPPRPLGVRELPSKPGEPQRFAVKVRLAFHLRLWSI